MAEYIERDAAVRAILEREGCSGALYDALLDVPTADVVEVRHGYWIGVNWGDFDRCSVCGCSVGRQQFKYHYCPKCGAKMDGKGEGEC